MVYVFIILTSSVISDLVRIWRMFVVTTFHTGVCQCIVDQKTLRSSYCAIILVLEVPPEISPRFPNRFAIAC